MKDFIRIGGEIVSSPLNENFRQLRNDISLSNINLIFPESNGIKANVDEMIGIVNPVNGQVCYVVSSGELYRYSTSDSEWHVIADFGNTFRQAFLNSGVVLIQQGQGGTKGAITYSNNKLTIPSMLVYFKTLEGSGRYLKGMYEIPSQELNVQSYLTGAGAYSIFLNGNQVNQRIENNSNLYSIESGMPSQDDPNKIYIGGFLVYNIGDDTYGITNEFIYTIPDIAYTADRGQFYLNGGQVKGCYLQTSGTHSNSVGGAAGKYYDEGANAPQGDVDSFSIDDYSGSNYNLRPVTAQNPIDEIIYMYPENALENGITTTNGSLIINKYYNRDTEELDDVPAGHFTIQKHLLTPNGQDIILYGDAEYNSLADAEANLNGNINIDINFPYVETTRIIVGCVASGFETDDPSLCRFYTLERLSQVGTIEPKFADSKFEIYSGSTEAVTPASIKFNLDNLQDDELEEIFTMKVLPYVTDRYKFGISQKFVDTNVSPITVLPVWEDQTRTIGSSSIKGYEIADEKDLEDIRTRLNAIEAEIWSVFKQNTDLYNQSLRYRLSTLEGSFSSYGTRITTAESNISDLQKQKVHKDTTINGYKLGDDLTSTSEKKTVVIKTGDISEGKGLGSASNLWYTDTRVNNNSNVSAAYSHSQKTGSGTVSNSNPHGLSFDNITDGSSVHGVTTAQQSKINNLPANTNSEITNLNTNKISGVEIKSIDGNSGDTTGVETTLGNIKTLKIYEDGVNINVSGNAATLEVIGQSDLFLEKSEFATLYQSDPVEYAGMVDKAVEAYSADYITGTGSAGPNCYYGTDADSEVGMFDLPVFVSTASGSSFATIDDVIFQPIDKSVRLAHLGDSSVTYGPNDEETTLGTNLHDLVVNHYHKAFDSTTLKSSEINEWNFGNNLTVTINGHKATINAVAPGSGATEFANLSDVDVDYETGNIGKMLVLGQSEGQYKIQFSDAPSLTDFMDKSTYVDSVDSRKVKLAKRADSAASADSATTASSLQGSYSVNDSQSGNTTLWSSTKVMSATVNTYSGTSVPASSLGKDGDIYVLIED